jgi:phytoene dehydrogenase-like protein
MEATKVLVTGAGIGGLTTALYLHAKGYDVQVYESVHGIKASGVGSICCHML